MMQEESTRPHMAQCSPMGGDRENIQLMGEIYTCGQKRKEFQVEGKLNTGQGRKALGMS